MPAYGSIPKVSPEDGSVIKAVKQNGKEETDPLLNSKVIIDGDAVDPSEGTHSPAAALASIVTVLQDLWSRFVALLQDLISKCCSEETRAHFATYWQDLKDAFLSCFQGSSSSSWLEVVAAAWTNLVFNWFTPVLYRGNEKKKLDPEDMDLVPFPEDCDTEGISNTFFQHWKEELQKFKTTAKATKSTKDKQTQPTEPSLVWALWHSFGIEFCKAGLLKFIHDACIFVGPQVLNAMIYYLRDADAPMSRGVGLTVLVTCSQLAMSFCLRHYFFSCYMVGLKIRTAMVMAVYQKALVLAAGERQTRTVGEITNLMSIDAKRLQGT